MFLIYKFIIMKKLLTLGLILLSTISFAQNGFNYKALITNNGNAVANQSVNIRFTLLENGTTSVYQETHSATTDANGIVSVDIGEGTIVSGDFSTLDWGNNTYFLKVEIDTGSGYQDFGTSELKYVPYAKYADKAGNVFSGDFNDLTNVPAGLSDGDDVNDADADPTNEIQTISKTGNTITLSGGGGSVTDSDTHLSDADIAAMGYIKNADDADADPANELQNLTLSGTQLSISNGNSVDFTGWDTDASDDFSGDYNDLSNKPHVWNVSGTTNAATNNSQSIVHYGFVGLGTNAYPGTSSARLYVTNSLAGNSAGVETYVQGNGTGSDNKYGFFATLNTSGDISQSGLYTNINNSGNAESAGVNNLIAAGGTGEKYGVKNLLNGGGSGEKYGVYNEIDGNGTGMQVGTSNNLGGTGTGIQVGTLNQVENDNDNILAGSVNLIHGNGNAILAGTHSTISGTGNGIVYAVSDSIINTGTGDHLGVHSYISGGSGDFYGMINELNEGDGDHYGNINVLSGNGNGTQLGSLNYIDNAGTGNKAGLWNIINTGAATSQIGVFNGLTGDNATEQTGIINILGGNNNGNQYGIVNRLGASGSGIHYAVYNMLVDGTGPKYGTYNKITATGTGSQIAVYGEVQDGTGNYAGQFVGDVQVTKKLVAPDSGDADMKAYIYGKVYSSGVVPTNPTPNSDGFSVTKTGTGTYRIDFDTSPGGYNKYLVVASIYASKGFISTSNYDDHFIVNTFDTSGNPDDKAFTFVVYKK